MLITVEELVNNIQITNEASNQPNIEMLERMPETVICVGRKHISSFLMQYNRTVKINEKESVQLPSHNRYQYYNIISM